MRVMCIDASMEQQPDCPIAVKEGDVFNVIDTVFDAGCWRYEFQECPLWGFLIHCFIPLSEIDEMELVNSQELQEA